MSAGQERQQTTCGPDKNEKEKKNVARNLFVLACRIVFFVLRYSVPLVYSYSISSTGGRAVRMSFFR